MIYLASRSPRRRELLQQIGVHFQVLEVDTTERREPGETPEAYVTRVAREKARAGHVHPDRRGDWPVLGCDTAVVVDGQLLGKPRDRAHALAMLNQLSGRDHRVLTGVALVGEKRGVDALSETRVWMAPIDARAAQAYWQSGEPRDKAGAYAIQGQAAVWVERIDGSYSGVMGLPLFETARLLTQMNVNTPVE